MLRPGETFDHYRIDDLIGRGGMTEVYRAFDTRLRRFVALKLIRTLGHVEDAPRLLRDARNAAALNHPHVVSIHDVGQVGGVLFVVMELIAGRTLQTYMRDGSITQSTRVRWLSEIARALAAAHAAGILHLDVKPGNVMITSGGSVKVLDFGIAKGATGAQSQPQRTGYMALEQLRGEQLDGRVDQFAWGVLGYELLTEEHPFPRSSLSQVNVEFQRPPTVSELAPVSPWVSAALMRAIGSSRDTRFPAMDDAIAAFDRAAQSEMAPSFEESARPSNASHMIVALAFATLHALILAGLVLAVVRRSPEGASGAAKIAAVPSETAVAAALTPPPRTEVPPPMPVPTGTALVVDTPDVPSAVVAAPKPPKPPELQAPVAHVAIAPPPPAPSPPVASPPVTPRVAAAAPVVPIAAPKPAPPKKGGTPDFGY